MSHSPDDRAIVYIVDDDEALRRALDRLFRSVSLETRSYGTAREFIDAQRPDLPGCIVLDIRLPGINGLEFQAQLGDLGINLPVVLITGHGDIPMTVRAMKSGAIDFLTKPVRDQDILDAVQAAIERDRKRRDLNRTVSTVRSRFESLSPRERDVLSLVTAGLMNKQVAAQLGLAEITVKIYRGQIMRKMGAKSLADLVRMSEALGIGSNKPGAQT
jgi:FixJ family two-component response regulator